MVNRDVVTVFGRSVILSCRPACLASILKNDNATQQGRCAVPDDVQVASRHYTSLLIFTFTFTLLELGSLVKNCLQLWNYGQTGPRRQKYSALLFREVTGAQNKFQALAKNSISISGVAIPRCTPVTGRAGRKNARLGDARLAMCPKCSPQLARNVCLRLVLQALPEIRKGLI